MKQGGPWLVRLRHVLIRVSTDACPKSRRFASAGNADNGCRFSQSDCTRAPDIERRLPTTNVGPFRDDLRESICMSISNILPFGKKATKQQPVITTRFPESGDACRLVRREGGWDPLGIDKEGRYVVLSYLTGTVRTLTSAQFNAEALESAFGIEYCRQAWSAKDNRLRAKRFDERSLVEAIRSSCQAQGLVDEVEVRHAGLYRQGDDLVVHFGQTVRALGAPLDMRGVAYNASKCIGFDGNEAPLRPEEARELVEAVRTFGLSGERDEIAMAGSIAAMFFGAVLPTRPVVALEAEYASGKTTWLNLVGALLNGQCERRDGIPSAAQVVHAMRYQPRALICDEVELSERKKRDWDAVAELARSGFTESSGPRIARVLGGKLTHFHAPAGVLLAGINLPVFDPAIESRCIRVRLLRVPERSRAALHPLLDPARRHVALDFGRRLRAALLSRWSVMRDTVRLVETKLIQGGHESRTAALWATVMAGYWTITAEAPPSEAELRTLVEQAGLLQAERRVQESQGDICLRQLLDARVSVPTADGRRTLPLAELLHRAKGGDADDVEVAMSGLQLYGLRLINKGGAPRLAIANEHPRLRQLLAGSPWSGGGWKEPLSRLADAQNDVQRFCKVAHRCVTVPISTLDAANELLGEGAMS